MTRSKIGGALAALAVGLVTLICLDEIAVAQGRTFDLTGEWTITQFGTWFTGPETYRLEKIDPDTFRVAGDKWPNTRVRFVGGELRFYSEAGVPGATGKKMDVDANGVLRRIEWSDGAVFTRTAGTGGAIGCQATFDGEWGDWGSNVGARRGTPPPGTEGRWGTWNLKQNGNNVTGTVPKMGERFGPATITATVSGKTFTGTWTAPGAKGKITLTRTADDCTMNGTYSVDEPPGERGGTVGQPTENLGPSTGHGGGNPWDTPEGKDCFERWIAEATHKLNAADLGPEGNTRKPWSFDKYGNLVSSGGGGIFTANAPDAWERHNRNKYWFMWDLYDTDGTHGQWTGGHLKTANVPALRTYVRNCTPGSTPGSTREPPLGDGMMLWIPNTYQVRKGERVNVKAYLINAKDVRNLDFAIDYNSSFVGVQGQPVRGAVVTELAESNLERPGLLKFNFARLTPFTFKGQAEVAGFTFEGLNVGLTPLTLSFSPGNKLPIKPVHGAINVYEGSRPPGTQWPPPITQPPGTGWEPTCSNTGRQTINDAQCCLQIWVGLKGPNPSMDQDGNGVVDSSDALIIMDRLAARGEYRGGR